jgi:hypothetical protein
MRDIETDIPLHTQESAIEVAELPQPSDLIDHRRACAFDNRLVDVVELLRQFRHCDDDSKAMLLEKAVGMIGRPATMPTTAQRPNERVFDDYFRVNRVKGDVLSVTLLNLVKTYMDLMPVYTAQKGGQNEEQWLAIMDGFDPMLNIAVEYLSRSGDEK